MAISTVQEASSSISKYSYHVFLSFRGEDTRKNFTDHLYTALVQAGIYTFRDEDEIERGENINDEIYRAILQKSKISLIVFSKNYASSRWCLKELVKIMEHRKSSNHIVFPVFYDVDPSQVRKQTGSFADAFAKHEERLKSEMEKVERWRAALREAADLGGMVLQDRHESQFIRDIVKQIQNKLHCTALYVPPCLVGIDVLVTCINWWLEDESNKVGIATICGIGGIGKTTIAKVVYNQNIHRFQGCSFLTDVREASQEHNGLVRLQRQLISDILKGKTKKIYNADDGITKIKEAICGRRVLLVLDDVEDSEKVTKIIGTLIHFHPGSKIIITSRHRHLLSETFVSQMFDQEASSSSRELHKVFEVKELAFTKSLQLFNWHAFGQNPITESYVEYASRVVKHCGGLPLALQVLGSSLSGKSIKVWESALEKLEAIPDSKIQKILRISYDSLQDDHDRNLFLDIACLFVGKDKDYATTILDGCGFYTTIGMENLIDRCLLIVNEKNKLMMHQMVREMGREIIRQESSELGKRSRLWHKDAFDVLIVKSGTKTVKCLTIDLQGLLKYKSSHSKNSFLMSSELVIETEAFAKMAKLKLLQLDYVKLEGEYKNFPKGLIWLRWHGCSLESLPVDFDIKRLVALDMRYSSLKIVWNNTKSLPNLKILNLSHLHGLLKTPNFSGLHSLERLMLKECIKLIEVDRSIGELKRLIFLSLRGCQSLRKLPRTIGSLDSLEDLNLSGCSRLDDVPRELQTMKSLRVLNLDETAIYESNFWLSWLRSLKRSKELGFFWAYLPCSLVKLSLEGCRLSDEAMPNDLSGLPSLKSLNLSRNPIHSLPESISSLTKLDELQLTYCTELQSLPKLPISSINGTLYSKVIPSVFSSLPYLLSFKRCVIFGCEKLSEVQDVYKMQPMQNFEAEHIKSLFNLISIPSSNVQIYNFLTDTKIVATPQVIQDCGITSTFIPGGEVPNSFEHRYKESKISFSLPPYPGKKIKWLNLCIVYSVVSDNILDFLPSIEITNETKENTWVYFSSFIGIPESNSGTMLWIIHWPVSHRQLEGGDCLSCIQQPFDLEIKEFGIACGLESNIKYELDFPRYSNPGNEDDIARNIGLELAEALLKLSISGNVKVHICNRLKDLNTDASPQVAYDCGIVSTFDARFKYKTQTTIFYRHHAFGPKICFTVPSNSSQEIRWLKSLIFLSHTYDDKATSEFLLRVEIVNETKDTKWSYYKSFPAIPGANSTIIVWLNSWKLSGELEAGDRVSLTVLSDLTVLECGIDLVYDQDEHDLLYSSSFLFGMFMSILFRCLRFSHQMQSLVKE